MSERKHKVLNQITAVDKFRVRAFSLDQRVYYIFQAHGAQSPNRPGEFNCHFYDSGSHEHSAYVETDTVATDAGGNTRCFATGKTLDELVHNMDWAHKPSELAQLKALLSTRRLTDSGEPVGDMVNLSATPEQAEHLRSVMSHRANTDIQAQAARFSEQAAQAIASAQEAANAAASFGLRQVVAPCLGDIKP